MFIMGTTQDPNILKEHTEFYEILKFRVNCANIEQDTAIQKLTNLLTNALIAGHLSVNVWKSMHFLENFEVFELLYLVQNRNYFRIL